MINPENIPEVINTIEKFKINMREKGAFDFVAALTVAIKALKKLIPMEIKEIHVDEYYCPACGSENNCSNKIVEHEYCPECGQKLVSRRKL